MFFIFQTCNNIRVHADTGIIRERIDNNALLTGRVSGPETEK